MKTHKFSFTILLLSIVITNHSFSQGTDVNKTRLKFVTGIRTIPFDGGSTGPVIGIRIPTGNNKLGLSILYSPCISIETGTVVNVDGQSVIDYNNYRVNNFQSRYYFEGKYDFWMHKLNQLSAHSGLGFVRDFKSYNKLTDNTNGYFAITLAFSYKYDWLEIETRYDLPLSNKDFVESTPFSVAFIYTFKSAK
jgi:hypothetical protein